MNDELNVSSAITEIIDQLGDDALVVTKDDTITVTVFGQKNSNAVERILDVKDVDFRKDDDDWPAVHYTFGGSFEAEGYPKKITLNATQKRFLFKQHYVTAKVLDAAVEEGWQDFYINCFDWELDLEYNNYGFRDLKLVEKDPLLPGDPIIHTIGLNFHDDDLDTLLKLK